MKKLLFALSLLASALVPSVSAVAADLDVPPPPTEELRPASYDWTGFYVGGWAGLACISDGSADSGTTPYLLAGCGGKAGALAGVNYQWDSFVVGLEGDYGWGSEVADNKDPLAAVAYSINSIGTARVRTGFALDNTLFFVTGGWAFANGELSGLYGVASTPFSLDKWHSGWTVGGGIEHAMSEHFRVRMDYLYTKMDVKTYSPDSCCNIDVDWGDEHEVRVGAIWAF